MAESTGGADRTLLIIGGFTVAGVGVLESALKKENSDGTWFFQEIVMLSTEVGCKTMLQDLGQRVSRTTNLPAVTQQGYQQSLTEIFAEMQETLKEVTHVLFTG